MRDRYYRPELDVIRFIAFACVFVHHSVPKRLDAFGDNSIWAATITALGFGLCLVFVLSAYLITALLLRELDGTGTIALGKFYKRRMLRIWPLYLAALGFGAIWSEHIGTFRAERVWFLCAIFMAGNLIAWPANLVSHLWSISVEEQFYLVWPSLVRNLNRGRLIACAICFILLANMTLLRFGLIHADTDQRIWGNTFVQFQMFAAGILLAIFTVDRASWLVSRIYRVVLAFCAPLSWFVSIYFLHIKGTGQFALGPISLCTGYALVALSCAFLIYAVLGTEPWPKPIVHMGRVSYGLYVFHWPVISLVRSYAVSFPHWFRYLLIISLTTILAFLSYRFFETPFLRLKKSLEVIPSRPISTD